MCDGQNSTETMFLAFICRNDFTVLMKTESEQLFGNSHASVCAWYLWSGVSPRPMGLSSDWLRSLWIVPAASWLAEAPDIRGLAIHHRVCVCVCLTVLKNSTFKQSTDTPFGSYCHWFEVSCCIWAFCLKLKGLIKQQGFLMGARGGEWRTGYMSEGKNCFVSLKKEKPEEWSRRKIHEK